MNLIINDICSFSTWVEPSLVACMTINYLMKVVCHGRELVKKDLYLPVNTAATTAITSGDNEIWVKLVYS